MKNKYMYILITVVLVAIIALSFWLIKSNKEKENEYLSDASIINIINDSVKDIPVKAYVPTKYPKGLVLKQEPKVINDENSSRYEFLFSKNNDGNNYYLKISYIHLNGEGNLDYFKNIVKGFYKNRVNTIDVYEKINSAYETAYIMENDVIYYIECLSDEDIYDIIFDITWQISELYNNGKIKYSEYVNTLIKDTGDSPSKIYFPDILDDVFKDLLLGGKPFKDNVNDAYVYMFSLEDKDATSFNYLAEYIYNQTRLEQVENELNSEGSVEKDFHGITVHLNNSDEGIGRARFIIDDIYYSISIKGNINIEDIVESITKQVDK